MRRIFIQRQGVNPEFLIFQAINLLNDKVKVRIAHPTGLGGLLWIADGDLEAGAENSERRRDYEFAGRRSAKAELVHDLALCKNRLIRGFVPRVKLLCSGLSPRPKTRSSTL